MTEKDLLFGILAGVASMMFITGMILVVTST